MPPKKVITGQEINPFKNAWAKNMRHEMTQAERILWTRLRYNRLEGFHFLRQQVIEPYIVDFYCHQVGLVIELDGGGRMEQQEYDENRDKELIRRGLKVLRFNNDAVLRNLEKVLGEIYRVCCERKNRPD
jgi:very-short-patch-repair endonuclease